MKVAGIIAEYNPFHKGHEYQFQEVKKRTGADFIVVVMSGDFTQRGIPSCMDKFTKAECAVLGGADLVLELPVCYATGSAEIFAEGGVMLLDRLSVVDTLCFGSENQEDASLFQKTAAFFCEEPKAYKEKLKELLARGLSFPKARETSAMSFLTEEETALLSSPNNILGLEYCKALQKKDSALQPFPIERSGAAYHEQELLPDSFASASALRNLLHSEFLQNVETAYPESFLQYLPEASESLLQTKPCVPLFSEDLNLLYRYTLEQFSSMSIALTSFLDVSRELSARFLQKQQPEQYEDFINRLKTRQYTRTRIERALLHILLSITTEKLVSFRENETCYARILSFSKNASPLMKAIKKEAKLPILTKPSQQRTRCTDMEKSLLSFDLRASRIYRSLVFEKYKVLLQDDFSYNVSRLSD